MTWNTSRHHLISLSTDETRQLIWKDHILCCHACCQTSCTFNTNVICNSKGSALNHYFFFFTSPLRNILLLTHKQELRRNTIAKAQCIPANISCLLQWSLSSLEGSAYEYPKKCIISSRKLTLLTPPNSKNYILLRAFIVITGILCFPIYLKTEYW